MESFEWSKHVNFFKKNMRQLPGQYKTMDTNRLALLYFCVSGLDLLGALDGVEKDEIIEYIYSLQSPLKDHGGFYGYPRVAFHDVGDVGGGAAADELDRCNNQPHIANTYTALVMLIILGDDLSRVNVEGIRHSLRKWQLEDGSFCCVHGLSNLDSESDMRFVYCAACICYVLDLWDAIDVEGMRSFISSSQSYDGAFGMGPLCESHGGCTYCALAALAMLGRLSDLPCKEQLIGWCAKRQQLGLNGRIEKPEDSCYSYWVGASMHLLGVGGLLQGDKCATFLRQCESKMTGGFQKFPEVRFPDLLHSYFSVAGLSLCGYLQPINCMLDISERAFASASGRFRHAPGARSWAPPRGGIPPRSTQGAVRAGTSAAAKPASTDGVSAAQAPLGGICGRRHRTGSQSGSKCWTQ